MKTSKLSIVILGYLQASQKDSTNAILASYLLEHMNETGNLSIKRIAEDCHVGIATVSRFVRDLGISDFSEFKDLLTEEYNTFSRCDSYQELYDSYTISTQACLKSIDQNKINSLCESMHASKTVYVFGLLKAKSAAIQLQADLCSLGKPVLTFASPNEQMKCIEQASINDCLVLFSDTSRYFEYFDVRKIKNHISQLNIWMIGSGQAPEYIKNHIIYQKPQVSVTHPIQLLFVADMISQCYAKRYGYENS